MHSKDNFQKFSIILISTSCLFYILLISATLNAATQYKRLQEFTNTFINCQKASAQLNAGSDYLTEQARIYVITQDQQNMDNYFAEVEKTRRSERAINQLAAYKSNNAAYDYLMAALDSSQLLTQREFYAIKLAALSQGMTEEELPTSLQSTLITIEDQQLSPQDMLAKAQNLLFNERYNLSKNTINTNLELAVNDLLDATIQEQQSAQHNLYRTMNEQCVLITIIFVENLLLAALFLKHRRNMRQPSK